MSTRTLGASRRDRPRPRNRLRAAGALLSALAVLAPACSVVTFDGDTAGSEPTSTIAPPTSLGPGSSAPAADDEPTGPAELCARLPGLPYTERRLLLSRQPDGPAAATEACPEELAAIERLEAVAAQSAQLDDDRWFDRALEGWDCTDRQLTASVRNVFEFPVRMIVVTQLVTDTTQEIVGTGWTVSAPVPPGAIAPIAIDYRPGPVLTPELTCNLSAQAFLALDDADAEITDTWDADLGLADPPPDTAGDDWARLLPLILAAEQRIEASGQWARAATYEDVRSKNYRGLVDGLVTSVAVDTEVLEVCGVERVAEDLRAVTWLQDVPGGRGVVLGVFHRSAIDERWRWVHTGIFLSDLDGDCSLVAARTA